MAAIEWFYAHSGERFGPFSAADIKRLADAGKVLPDDLVWRDGMDQWIAAHKVKGLFDAVPAAKPIVAKTGADVAVAPPPPPSPAPVSVAEPINSAEKPAERVVADSIAPLPLFEELPRLTDEPPARTSSLSRAASSQAEAPRHPVDHLLEHARAKCSIGFIHSAAMVFAAIGHFSLLAAAGLVALFAILAAAKTGSVTAIPLGLTGALLLVTLQYAAYRFLQALPRLVQGQPTRLGTSVLPDGVALLGMVLGLVLVLHSAVVAAQLRDLWHASTGIVGFVICEYLAFVALNPAALNVRVESGARGGEEALGAVAFLARAAAQLAPVAFGVGAAWCVPPLLYAFYVLARRSVAVANGIVLYEMLWLLAFALLPVAGYVASLLLALLGDVLTGLRRLGSGGSEQSRGGEGELPQ